MTYCIQCTRTGVIGCNIPGAENYNAIATLPWDESCANFTMGTTNLFFASMGETKSSSSNWFTIYNPTNVDVSLNRYFIRNPADGGDYTVRSYQFVSDAFVPANGLYKMCNRESAETSGRHAGGSCDAYYDNVIWIFGDDAIQLAYGLLDYYIIIDTIGDENGDPGTAWTVCGVATATKDHILVRKSGRIVGDSDWTASAGTNADDCEWTVFGPHTSDSDPSGYMHSKVYPLISGCTSPTACNYDVAAGVDDASCIEPTGCDTCLNGAIEDNDADDDGVCDADEVAGCDNPLYQEFNAARTDDNAALCQTPLACTTNANGDACANGVLVGDQVAGCSCDCGATGYEGATCATPKACIAPDVGGSCNTGTLVGDQVAGCTCDCSAVTFHGDNCDIITITCTSAKADYNANGCCSDPNGAGCVANKDYYDDAVNGCGSC